MNKYFKLDFKIIQILKIFIITFIICSLTLILASIIPDKKIDNNVEESIKLMNKEGEYPIILNQKSSYYQIDNWTEAALLNFIYNCDSKKPLECTFAEKTYVIDGGTGLENANLMLKEIGHNSAYTGEKVGHYYLRSSYWLGGRTIYMPLLTFINYYQIRYVILAVGILLSLFTAIEIAKKINWKYAIAFMLSLILTNYYVGLLVSPQALVYILTFLGMDYILLKKKKVNYFNFMFIIGMLTTYFDWFSIPLISWGFIIITILLKEYHKNKKMEFSELFNIIFQTGVAWCLGYASLLMFRILFSYLVVGNDAIKYFTGRVSDNTSVGESSIIINIAKALKNSLNGLVPILILKKDSLIKIGLFFLVFLIFNGIILIVSKKLIKINKSHIVVPLLLISLSPLVWIITFNGFHAKHAWFAYRSLGIYVFAIFIIFIMYIDNIISKSKKVNNVIVKLKDWNVIRFLIVGGISTLMDYIIYMVISIKFNLIVSKCISMICAGIFSFVNNKTWTFRINEKVNTRMLFLYILTQLINIGTNTTINYLMFGITHIKTISFIIATFVAMVVNYLLQNYVVFKGEKKYEVFNSYSLL